MRCTRCGKRKPANESPQCLKCSHIRSGARLFAVKRQLVIAGNVRKSLANRLAKIGMTRLLNQYLGGALHG